MTHGIYSRYMILICIMYLNLAYCVDRIFKDTRNFVYEICACVHNVIRYTFQEHCHALGIIVEVAKGPKYPKSCDNCGELCQDVLQAFIRMSYNSVVCLDITANLPQHDVHHALCICFLSLSIKKAKSVHLSALATSSIEKWTVRCLRPYPACLPGTALTIW